MPQRIQHKAARIFFYEVSKERMVSKYKGQTPKEGLIHLNNVYKDKRKQKKHNFDLY